MLTQANATAVHNGKQDMETRRVIESAYSKGRQIQCVIDLARSGCGADGSAPIANVRTMHARNGRGERDRAGKMTVRTTCSAVKRV